MPIKILMPALSPTMQEGNLAKWLKQEGDKIKPGDVIAEIETDKATMEVEAVDEGIIARIIVPAGSQNVAVNSLIAVLLEEGEAESAVENIIEERKKTTKTTDTNAVQIIAEAPIDVSKKIKEDRVFASPIAKRIAAERNIDLHNIQGSGPHGRIIKQDILNAATNTYLPTQKRTAEEFKLVANSNIRRIIAKRLVESKQNIPHFYLSIECNIDKLLSIREDLNSVYEEQKLGKISVNDLVIKAVALALKKVPEANSSWSEEGIKYYNNIDVSVAVAIDGGLITPIIKNADYKPILELSNNMKDLAKRARENKLAPEEFQGGGFSISNLGMYGIKNFKAIINPPQSCILAVGESNKRPVVINDEIKIATIMDVSLSCDHRVVDGAVGARFLNEFKRLLEHPALLLI